MTILDACFEQSIFSIQDDPGGFSAERWCPSCLKVSTHFAASGGILLLIQRLGPSPSAAVSCDTSCGVIQYTPGFDGSLVPYFSYVILSTHQLNSFCSWIVSAIRPSSAVCVALGSRSHQRRLALIM